MELIVVIAILAILGGVAIPAYTGYVKRAERAGDEQLLAELNRAFASACAVNGENHIGRSDVLDITLENKQIPSAYVLVNEIIDGSFDEFYEGDEFNVITKLYYDGTRGAFAENTDVTYKGQNGVTYKASESDIAKYKETTWYKYLESKELLELVDTVVNDVQGGKTTDEFTALIENDAFKKAAASVLGITEQEYSNYVADMKDDLMEQYVNAGMPPLEAYNKASGQIDGNLAVLVSANRAEEAGNSILSILTENKGQGVTGRLDANMDADATLGFSQTALAYGLYTSYIYSDNSLTPEQKREMSTAEKALSGGFESAGFQDYLNNNPQAQKDLQGLLAAMHVAGSQNKDTASSVVIGGLASQDMIDAMNGILGN